MCQSLKYGPGALRFLESTLNMLMHSTNVNLKSTCVNLPDCSVNNTNYVRSHNRSSGSDQLRRHGEWGTNRETSNEVVRRKKAWRSLKKIGNPDTTEIRLSNWTTVWDGQLAGKWLRGHLQHNRAAELIHWNEKKCPDINHLCSMSYLGKWKDVSHFLRTMFSHAFRKKILWSKLSYSVWNCVVLVIHTSMMVAASTLGLVAL